MTDPGPSAQLDRRFVFLGGLHRSGTSLLFKILRDHPDISGFHDTGVSEDEGQLLQSVYPPARKYGGPGKFGFNPESCLDESSPLVSPDNARILFEQWSRYWNTAAPLLLEKSPPNLVRARFLQALFPNSHFIMLLRHPAAVALATQKWSRTPLPSLIEHWTICHERFADDRRYLNHLLTLKYEELVATPDATVEQVHRFLDVRHTPLTQQVESTVNRKYFERWRETLKNQSGKKITEFLQRMEPRVNRFGYSLLELDRLTPLEADFTRPAESSGESRGQSR